MNIDNAIINGCKKQDEKSQKKLYYLLGGYLYKTCLLYASNKDQADEYLQKSFIRIFDKIKQFKNIGSFEGWAIRITKNIIFDDFKKKKLLKYPNNNFTFENIADVNYDNNNEDDTIPNVKEILKAVSKLSPSYRMVFNLRVFENMTHKEISKKLKITEGASKSAYSRAKTNIRKTLQKNKA